MAGKHSVSLCFMTVPEFCTWARIGRTKTYEEIKAGKLRAFKVGRKTLIDVRDAGKWADEQPDLILWRTPEEVFGMESPDGA
ncbi:MAG: helix-turn-helix domain-containing protein [Novosphingobium sp.]|uniref:helix-turn-helix domain-containing protein n=1 Tax=Novosphingobium sp. TaxID=1874826 RepID=UPI003B9D4CC9